MLWVAGEVGGGIKCTHSDHQRFPWCGNGLSGEAGGASVKESWLKVWTCILLALPSLDCSDLGGCTGMSCDVLLVERRKCCPCGICRMQGVSGEQGGLLLLKQQSVDLWIYSSRGLVTCRVSFHCSEQDWFPLQSSTLYSVKFSCQTWNRQQALGIKS